MTKRETKTEEFRSPGVPDKTRIQHELLSLARKRGYGIYRPKLHRQEETTIKEGKADADGTRHILQRITVRPSVLEECQDFDKGLILIQNDKDAYIMASDSQQIGPFHPLDDPVLLDFLCLAKVPRLTVQLDQKQEGDWLADVRNRVPKPSHERFEAAHIENKVEGMLVEIQHEGNVLVTLHSKEKLLRDFSSLMKKRLSLI